MSLFIMLFACATTTTEIPKEEQQEEKPKVKTYSSIDACIKHCVQQSQMQSRPIDMIERDCKQGCENPSSPLENADSK